MVLEFTVTFEINSGTQGQMLTDVNWIASNYGTDVVESTGGSLEYKIVCTLGYTILSDMTDAIAAFIAQFTTSLDNWSWSMRNV